MSAEEVELSDHRLVKPFFSSLSKFAVVGPCQTTAGRVYQLAHSRACLLFPSVAAVSVGKGPCSVWSLALPPRVWLLFCGMDALLWKCSATKLKRMDDTGCCPVLKVFPGVAFTSALSHQTCFSGLVQV